MGLSTFETVAVIQGKNSGMRIDTFKSYQDVILRNLDCGLIGDGCYGSDAHLLALRDAELQIFATRKKIREQKRAAKNKKQSDWED